MSRHTHTRALALGLVSAAVLAPFAGCGGGDEPADSEATTTSTVAEAIDAAAFESCILNASIDRGVYEEVPNPAPEVEQVAADSGAEFFEASKADEGLVFFYVAGEGAATEELAAAVTPVLADLTAELAASAPKTITLGESSVETEGPVVYGLLPFSAETGAEMAEEVRSDVADCVSES